LTGDERDERGQEREDEEGPGEFEPNKSVKRGICGNLFDEGDGKAECPAGEGEDPFVVTAADFEFGGVIALSSGKVGSFIKRLYVLIVCHGKMCKAGGAELQDYIALQCN